MMTIPVKYYSQHKCDKTHQTAETFLKCAMKWAKNGSGNWQTMTHSFRGTGEWAVVHRCYNESSSSHNGLHRDTSYYSLQIDLYDNQEDALSGWSKIDGYCYGSNRCSGSCAGLDQHVIKVCI